MNWGHKIAILYLSFVAFILFFVIRTFYNKSELVTTEYYKEELNFQNKLDKLNNAASIKEGYSWSLADDRIQFSFPNEFRSSKVNVSFLRPSDASRDTVLHFSLDTLAKGSLPVIALGKGYYKMNIAWSSNGVDYLKEESITLQ